MTVTDLIIKLEGASSIEPDILAKKMKLLRQVNYIFCGFGNLIMGNREKCHFSYNLADYEITQEDYELIQSIIIDLEHILQMFFVVLEKYYKEQNQSFQEDMLNLDNLFDIILCENDAIPTQQIIAQHQEISQTYEKFQVRAFRMCPATWRNNKHDYDEIELLFTKEFLDIQTGPFSKIFNTKKSKTFHQKFVRVIRYYHTLLYSSSILGDNLNENEIEFLTFVFIELNEHYPNLTYIIRDDCWEEIDYAFRERLLELIDNLIPKSTSIQSRTKYDGTVVEEPTSECDYSIVKKYLCCHNSTEAEERIYQIMRKIKNPYACRIENMLTDLSDFFKPNSPIEDKLDINDLIILEKKLNSVIKIKRKIEQKFEEDYSLTGQIDCIFDKNIL